MKKFAQFVCVILVCSFIFAAPAQAASVAEPRGSAFFGSYGTALEKTSASTFRIWYDVDSNVHAMDVLGVSEIIVYRSADQQSWQKMRTYTKEIFTSMVDYNTSSHAGYVTYSGASAGYYYIADVTFYAENSTGHGERYVYTQIIQMG